MDDSEEESKIKENARKTVEESKEQLEKHLRIQKNKVDDYTEYYSNNREEIIDGFISNLDDKTREPAVAGTIVLAPILIVLIVVDWILSKVNEIPFIDLLNFTDIYLFNQVIKLVFIIGLGAFLVTSIGRFVRTKQGFEFEKTLDRLMEKIPFLGSIYGISKLTADTVFNGAEEFSDPVKIEIQGVRLTGYRTGNKTVDGREIIFVPTSPNVTTGFVTEIKPEDVIETEESPQESLTRTLSAGFGEGGSNKPKRSPVEEEDKHIPVEDDES